MTGFKSVALTIDHGWLSPHDPATPVLLEQIKAKLDERGLSSVVETGARFLLSPRQKHFPTLMESEPALVQQRIDFLKYCIDKAVILGSDCVSIWSGKQPADMDFNQAMDLLANRYRAFWTMPNSNKSMWALNRNRECWWIQLVDSSD